MTLSARKSLVFPQIYRIVPPMRLLAGLSGGWSPYLERCFFW